MIYARLGLISRGRLLFKLEYSGGVVDEIARTQPWPSSTDAFRVVLSYRAEHRSAPFLVWVAFHRWDPTFIPVNNHIPANQTFIANMTGYFTSYATHRLRIVQRVVRRRAQQRRLAVAMAFHARLGAASDLARLDPDLVRRLLLA